MTRAAKVPKPLSEGEETLAVQTRLANLPEPQRQAKLIPGRRWVWDFAWDRIPSRAYRGLTLQRRIAVEVHGGIWGKGRKNATRLGHATGTGLERDFKKANAACLAGYRTLFFSTAMVKSGEAIATLERMLR